MTNKTGSHLAHMDSIVSALFIAVATPHPIQQSPYDTHGEQKEQQ
jgi:hypothetical protein